MMLLKNIYNLSDEGVVVRWMDKTARFYFFGYSFLTPDVRQPRACGHKSGLLRFGTC